MNLTGKTKIIVDQNSFKDLVRDPETSRIISNSKYRSNNFLDYAGADTVRIGLGDYWDYTPLEDNFDFSNNHHPAEVFCNGQLEIEYCEDDPLEIKQSDGYNHLRQRLVLKARVTKESLSSNFKFIYPGENTNDLLSQYGNDDFYWSYLMKYGLRTVDGKRYYPIIKTNQNFTDHYHEILLPYTQDELDEQHDIRTFSVKYETYYNGRAPSNVDIKLASKGSLPSVPNGNTFYENFIANEGIQNCLPNIYAFAKLTNVPSIADEQFGLGVGEIVHGGPGGNNINAPVKLIDYYLFSPPSAAGQQTALDLGRIKNDTYANLFRHYPLESSLLLYGAMTLTPDSFNSDVYEPYGPELLNMFNNYSYILQNTPSFNSLVTVGKNTDSDSLFRQWFNSFQYVLQNDPNFNFEPVNPQQIPLSNRYGFKPITKVGALEYSNSILAFSPRSFKSVLEKAQKYKYFFPMFFQMQFTTSPSSKIGEVLKNTTLSKYFMQKVASTFTQYGLYEDQSDFLTAAQSLGEFAHNPSTDSNFIDFASKSMKIQKGAPDLTIPILENDSPYSLNSKKIIDFPELIKDFIEDFATDPMPLTTGEEANLEGEQNQDGVVHAPALDDQHPLWNTDVRNYFSYIRDDATEEIKDDFENATLAVLLNTYDLMQKVKNTYNEKARSYKDILDGKKAHTEDLFYIIRKYRNTVDGYANVQNIIIPNNDDLDILTYIDTQVKYGSDAAFTYDVFCYRLVYGSRYKYSFINGTDIPSNSQGDEVLVTIGEEQMVSAAGGAETILNTGVKLQQINGANWSIGLDKQVNDSTVNFTATVNVDVFPSVKLIADKIFSTREVRILDKPPVPPDVNIVPFRAVNNKVRILLASQTDTIREEPVIILENDSVSFDQLAQSQFSYDGKIEFSSDDSVSSYEVFRSEERPMAYSDFKLHPTIPLVQGSFSSFDDQILPNKKYYYTFRAIDAHGHFSNPTPVYEVELIDEKGAVKPIIRVISMEPQSVKHPAKEAQKYIHIKPSLKQLYFPENEDVDSIFSEKDSAKSKKYKMRITSKKTGKQIDVNFSFDKKVK